MRYRLQRHDGTDCSATMVPFTVLRMVPIQRYRHSRIADDPSGLFRYIKVFLPVRLLLLESDPHKIPLYANLIPCHLHNVAFPKTRKARE